MLQEDGELAGLQGGLGTQRTSLPSECNQSPWGTSAAREPLSGLVLLTQDLPGSDGNWVRSKQDDPDLCSRRNVGPGLTALNGP